MTKSLSPAAQAVMDAYQSASDGCYVNGEWIQDHAGQIAAALRAVADRVVPEGSACMIPMPETDVDGNEAGGMLLTAEPNARIRRGILGIAAELEGQL